VLARSSFGDVALRYGDNLEKGWVQAVFKKAMALG